MTSRKILINLEISRKKSFQKLQRKIWLELEKLHGKQLFNSDYYIKLNEQIKLPIENKIANIFFCKSATCQIGELLYVLAITGKAKSAIKIVTQTQYHVKIVHKT